MHEEQRLERGGGEAEDPGDLDLSGAAFGVGGGLRAGAWDYRMEYSVMSGGDSGDGGVLGMFAMYHF